MNLKSFLLTVTTVCTVSGMFAQANILNAKSPEEIGVRTDAQKAVDNDKPLEYGYVDDRDILFSKMTWEKVVLDERSNFPLYYPIDTNNISSNRRSLYDVLMKNIKNGKIANIYDDSYFNAKRTLKDIESALSKIDTTGVGIEQLNAGEELSAEYINRRDITAAEIREYHIKGLWYFDKRQAEMKYRLLGIAPVAPDVNFIDDDEPDLVELFWIFFPDAREVLHEAKSFNNKNSSMPFSFDHILNARRFHGYTYKEENVQGDRAVSEYISDNALMQLLESDRIKDKIRDFELDMWTY
ncbi:gliding motility protein GldN [Algibacter lectus]|uniref:Protein involved in gliding motility GldN n=1 Tax=Algibacter lectus TaxID=221126 RepID=A0A4R8M5W3_9FLAO|nr:gliding motility protein GldN [Algibacter lectus]MDO7138663.1 gliding motility protein GldN [Algibacter lectus]MWW25985.1 gliding motility protein GldN [Algibacter lectus]TDY60713.1 protein involved in gliding motility GldN [Algibacter lectus]SFD31614.1 gliding motility associated protien GldN [Algibacter lectus]